MSIDLSSFIYDNNNDSNYDIAKRIKLHYDWMDTGYYTVIVSDKRILSRCSYSEDKYRYIQELKSGKYIKLWKQEKSKEINKTYEKQMVKLYLEELIEENGNDITSIKRKMDNEYGKSWIVLKSYNDENEAAFTHQTYYHFIIKCGNEWWNVWKQY